jgi:hypothetical protein
MATALAQKAPTPAAANRSLPFNEEFLPNQAAGPDIQDIRVAPNHPNQSVSSQIAEFAADPHNTLDSSLVGLRMEDRRKNVYEVTEFREESRTVETIGIKGLGFDYHKGIHLNGGPGFKGNARVVKSETQKLERRNVRVTNEHGVSTGFLTFNTREEFNAFIDNNAPNPNLVQKEKKEPGKEHHEFIAPEKFRLREPGAPLGFTEFGWTNQERQDGNVDIIPTPIKNDEAVDVSDLEAQRKRLGKDSLEDLEWRDASGRLQKIVFDGITTESQREPGDAYSKLPRDLQAVVTNGSKARTADYYQAAENQRGLRTVRIQTTYVTPKHKALDKLPKRHFIQRFRKKSRAKIIPGEDQGGTTFTTYRTMSLDELQAHFTNIADRRKADPAAAKSTAPEWHLQRTESGSEQQRLDLLYQEEITTLKKAGLAKGIGGLALAQVANTKPSRDPSADPGVNMLEAMWLVSGFDFADRNDPAAMANWDSEVQRMLVMPEGQAARYAAECLQEAINDLGSSTVAEAADSLFKDYQKAMRRSGMPEIAKNTSISWAYQKLGTRYAEAKRSPDQTAEDRYDKLTPGDPFAGGLEAETIRRELIDVALGEQLTGLIRTREDVKAIGEGNTVHTIPVFHVNFNLLQKLPINIQGAIRLKMNRNVSEPLLPKDYLEMGQLLEDYWAEK